VPRRLGDGASGGGALHGVVTGAGAGAVAQAARRPATVYRLASPAAMVWAIVGSASIAAAQALATST